MQRRIYFASRYFRKKYCKRFWKKLIKKLIKPRWHNLQEFVDRSNPRIQDNAWSGGNEVSSKKQRIDQARLNS
jgi:flagellar biosynthesis chaperone FliJ